MGKASRDKGKLGEREIAKILRDRGYDAHRGVQYHGGPDSPDVVGLPGVHIEVKRVENFRLYDSLEQAKGDSNPECEIPVVFHRKSRKGWVAVLDLDNFLDMYEMCQRWAIEGYPSLLDWEKNKYNPFV